MAADCTNIFDQLQGFDEEAPEDPEVGDELTDEYKDFLQSAIDQIEDVDVETDEVQAGVDSFVEFAEEVIDSDTWTEELETRSATAIEPLGTACANVPVPTGG